MNILSVELDEPLDEAGFRHVATSVGLRLGAQRIGASVYQAEAGVPIWPYHYHHGIEEWLYVIAGAPVLREPAGERTPDGGRPRLLPVRPSRSPHRERTGSVRDLRHRSARRAVDERLSRLGQGQRPGRHPPPKQRRRLLARRGNGGAVEAGRDRARAREVAVAAGRERAGPRGRLHGRARLGPLLGADRLDATVVDLDPGEGSEPYHYVYGREEWLLVLAGTPTLRHPQGEDHLEAGDLVCFPEGPAGAHRLLNRGESVVRALFLSTTGVPANVCYPDTGHWLIRNGPRPGSTL